MFSMKFGKTHNSFKLGVLTGVCFFLFIENVVGMFLLTEFQITRMLLAVIFGGLACLFTSVARRNFK